MCFIWDVLRSKQSANQKTRPLIPPHRAHSSSSTISSNQETRPLIPPHRTSLSTNKLSSNQKTRPPISPNHTGPQTASSNKTLMASSADSIIHSSPMSGLSEFQIGAVQPVAFDSLYTTIQRHLCRLQRMHISRDRDERAAATRLLTKAVSDVSPGSIQPAKVVVFERLFEQITREYLPGIQTLFDEGERSDATAKLIMARSALDKALKTYGWSSHLSQWPDA